MKPVVSVVIPAYNSEDYIAQALKSVFAQTYHNFEIILVDDASTDSTLKIARSFNDHRLTIIENLQNRGVSCARNLGIRRAQGNWIALLDSDDWYAPRRLENLLKVALEQNADLVADDLFLVREQEKSPWSTLLQENQQQIISWELIDAARFVQTDRPAPINAPKKWSYGYTKPLIKREFLHKHNLEYNELISVGEDFVLYLQCLLKKARFLLIAHPYYYYRIRDLSLSSRKPTEYLAQSWEITQSFINFENVSEANPELLKVIYQNLKTFKNRLAYYRTVEYFKQKKLLSALRQILICPYVLIDFINKLITVFDNQILSIFFSKRLSILI
ncbi:glycosyltransferase family 2 protein [Pleurocapsa sp. PCC 7319]|uniref:glycosyltransferase family 2 protein n=1 Tax=Pleurocapsa sp. PCC 7319 TaxID=118161 RepID=UPI00034B1459|nr:glycosyltransferase family 2 protein [Pleurocapsa sp. PCC 7319]